MNTNKYTSVITDNGNGGEVGALADNAAKKGNDEVSFISSHSPKEPTTVRRRVEIYATMQKGIFDHYWQRTVDSGEVTPNPETEAIYVAHAGAMAEDAFRENFNPDESLHDKSRQEEFEKWRKEIVEAKQALLNEKTKLKEAEIAASKAKSNVPETPEFPLAIVGVAVPLITITVSFALFDSFVNSLGFILALTFSLLAGLCWGSFISYLILHKYHSDETGPNWTHWLGMIAGVGMAVALGFIRLSQSSAEFLWLLVGLTLLEICIVLALEFFARRYRKSLSEYSQKASAAGEAQGDADAIKAEIERRQERVNELQNKIDDHLMYLDERELRAKQKDQFVASAKMAAADAHRGACAHNKGKILK